MGVDFTTSILLPNYDFWSRDITVTPTVSQPGAGSYGARGIFRSQGTIIDVGRDEWVEVGDQQTKLDIRDVEFTIIPQQGDMVYIPPEDNMPGGTYEIVHSENNGGGETTFDIRKWEPAAP